MAEGDNVFALVTGSNRQRVGVRTLPGVVAFCKVIRELSALQEVPRPGMDPNEDDSTTYDYRSARLIVEAGLGEGHPMAGPLSAYLLNVINGWVPDPDETWFAQIIRDDPSVVAALG